MESENNQYYDIDKVLPRKSHFAPEIFTPSPEVNQFHSVLIAQTNAIRVYQHTSNR